VKGAAVDVQRSRVLRAPVERVWAWMCEPARLELFRVNPFHAEAACGDAELRVGSRVRMEQRLGPWREPRIARVATLRRYELAWSEVRADAEDWFPHSQRFTLEPRDGSACVLTNRLRGSFHLPGAGWWLMPWYRHVLPLVLDVENRRIARATEEAAGKAA